MLKLVQVVLQCLAPKHLLGSKTVVNKILIQEFLAIAIGMAEILAVEVLDTS
jgi:hypothetical protein